MNCRCHIFSRNNLLHTQFLLCLYAIPVRADNYFIGLSLNREIWKTQKHLPASSMPWARIAPNLAMTSSCLSLMTLEYSCLNWFTWRNKKKNYSWNLLFCCVISEQATYCSNGNETWVLNFTTFKRGIWTRFEDFHGWNHGYHDFSGVGAPVLFSVLIPRWMIQTWGNVECSFTLHHRE